MMLTRRTILISAVCVGAACRGANGAVFAEDASALALVKGVYAAYRGKDAKGIPLDNAAFLRRYFHPSLAALIVEDQRNAVRRNEAPKLDGDPFVDAQDWEIPDFDIAVANTGPGKATATVKFVNQGEPTTVVPDLITVNANWRINDIIWSHDGKPEALADCSLIDGNVWLAARHRSIRRVRKAFMQNRRTYLFETLRSHTVSASTPDSTSSVNARYASRVSISL